MFEVLTVTGPIFLLMSLGYASVHLKVFELPQMRVLGRFVLLFCLPALLFDAVSRRRIDEVLVASYAAAYALGSIVVMLGGMAWARWRRGAPMSLAALQGMGMSCPNSGFIGYPIHQQLFGAQAAAGLLALNMLVENLLLLPLSLALAGAGGHGQVRRALVEALRGLITNPLVIAIFLGLVAALLGWRASGAIDRTVQLLAGAASPLSLFVIGGTLVSVGRPAEGTALSMGEARGDVLRVALAKLLLHPLIVVGFILVLPPMTAIQRVGLVLTAAMPMMSIYPVLAQKYQHERFCAAALLVATVLSFFTISVALWCLRRQPGWLP